MSILPDLSPRHLRETYVSFICNLRLVSKEVGEVAMSSVRSCEVHLGEGGGAPNPQQLVKLMSGSQLTRLKFILNVTSGVCDLCLLVNVV